MERIGIFGGTFNPVHNEHVAVARQAVKELKLDKLYIVPTFLAPHKNGCSVSAEHRINMLRLAFEGEDKIEISTFETDNGGTSYSYITAEHFKKNTDGEVFMIVGGDMLHDFKNWKYPERILDAVSLCAFLREDEEISVESEREYFKKTFRKDFRILDYHGKKQSSTRIRVYNSFGLDISEMTDAKVVSYVRKNNLYEGNEYQKEVIKRLPLKRLIHTANVVTCALKKAKALGLDEEKVITACSLHDIAKYTDYKTVKGFVLPKEMPKAVIHSHLGAYIIERYLGIKDKDILSAVKYHTSGRANMSDLEKLVFVSDMIEDGRDYDGVEYLRECYKGDFENCFIECVKEEIQHLLGKNQYIYFETINCYNYYANKKGEDK